MTIEEITIYILLAISIFLVLWIVRLEIKFRNLPATKQNQNINLLEKQIADLNSFRDKTLNKFNLIDSKLKKKIGDIKTNRFNPFKGDGVGGNQSFATRIIDEEGNGVIISSLYSRERVSVFAKPVKNWNCEYELSEEEKEILKKD